jgi:hypothetical protein
METARYHRDRAALCLQIVSLLSDPVAARLMRMAAARHCGQVAELEALSPAPSATLRDDGNGRDDFSDSFYYRAIRTRIGGVEASWFQRSPRLGTSWTCSKRLTVHGFDAPGRFDPPHSTLSHRRLRSPSWRRQKANHRGSLLTCCVPRSRRLRQNQGHHRSLPA